MRKLKILIGSLFSVFAMSSPLVAEEGERERFSAIEPEDEVYALLPHFVLDLKREAFLNEISSQVLPLDSCSDDENVCLKSSEFHFSLPRQCAARALFFEEGGDGEMTIPLRYERMNGHYKETISVIYNSSFPKYALLVRDRGVAGMLYEPKGNLLQFLSAENVSDSEKGKDVGFVHTKLRSMIPLARCVR